MVCTEHSNLGHDRFGAELEHTDILAARAENPRLLIFQGLEWYIPGAEHATVFTAPGPGEVSLLRDFERAFDGKLLASADERLAVAALKWLASRPAETLVLANHPSRLGIDSPHELRGWRDAAPGIMIGMEGAPGTQGAAMPNLHGTVPRLAYLDVIRGAVRGPARDRDAWRAPDTRVIDTADVSRRAGRYTLRFTLTARESSYLRIRGADGRRNGPGQLGRHIDPHGPLAHPPGDGDPWLDTWLYTNPIFVDVS